MLHITDTFNIIRTARHIGRQRPGLAALKFFREEQAESMAENIEKEAYRFSWERMGDVIERFIKRNDERM